MAANPRSLGVVMGTGSLYVESSGTYLAVKGLAQTLGRQGHDVTVVGTRDRWNSPEPAGYGPARALAFRKVGPGAPSITRLDWAGGWQARRPRRTLWRSAACGSTPTTGWLDGRQAGIYPI